MKGFMKLGLGILFVNSVVLADHFIHVNDFDIYYNQDVDMNVQKLDIRTKNLQEQLKTAMLKEDGEALARQVNQSLKKLHEVNEELRVIDAKFSDVGLKQATQSMLRQIDVLKKEVQKVGIRNESAVNNLIGKMEMKMLDLKGDVAQLKRMPAPSPTFNNNVRIQPEGSAGMNMQSQPAMSVSGLREQIEYIEFMYKHTTNENIRDMYHHIDQINDYLLTMSGKKGTWKKMVPPTDLMRLKEQMQQLSDRGKALEERMQSGPMAEELASLKKQIDDLEKGTVDLSIIKTLESKMANLDQDLSDLKQASKTPGSSEEKKEVLVKSLEKLEDGIQALNMQEKGRENAKKQVKAVKNELVTVERELLALQNKIQ